MESFSWTNDITLQPLLATFVLGFCIILLLLWYSSRKHNYWKKEGIPYVKPFPVLGSVLENLKEPRHETELKRYNKYGRIYGHYEGNRALLSVGEPEILRDILVKDFSSFTGRRSTSLGNKIMESMLTSLQGEDWKRVRSIVTPTFTTGKIKRMINIFKECSETLVLNFKKAAEKGEPIDAKEIYGAFTMDIIASSAFSTKIDSHNDPNNQFVQNARQLLNKTFWRTILFLLFPKLIKHMRITPKGVSFFRDVTLQIIEQRKKTGQKRNDFLQLLIDTAEEISQESKSEDTGKDDITANYGPEKNEQIFKQNVDSKKSLSYDELVAQCLIFFLAGYDTTASTLSFASYSLALNPDVQEKLIEEVDDTLRNNNGELTYENVQNMKYLDNVISETLRLYPPVVRVERIADKDYKLVNPRIIIPKGMVVSIPIYAMHRDPKLFPEPEKFNPDRFTLEERSKRNPYAYIPFVAGPRNCIGMRFALMEIKMCLAHVLRNYRFKTCPETKVVGQISFLTISRQCIFCLADFSLLDIGSSAVSILETDNNSNAMGAIVQDEYYNLDF